MVRFAAPYNPSGWPIIGGSHGNHMTTTETALIGLQTRFDEFLELAANILAEPNPDTTELKKAIYSVEKRLEEVKYWV